jgi:hypothetical protein
MNSLACAYVSSADFGTSVSPATTDRIVPVYSG